MAVLSFPIRFASEADGRHFVRRVVPLLEIPCLVLDDLVHVIVAPEDFDAVISYASQFGGAAQYGPRWSMR